MRHVPARAAVLALPVATLELKLDVLARALERRYRADQPRNRPAQRSAGSGWRTLLLAGPRGRRLPET